MSERGSRVHTMIICGWDVPEIAVNARLGVVQNWMNMCSAMCTRGILRVTFGASDAFYSRLCASSFVPCIGTRACSGTWLTIWLAALSLDRKQLYSHIMCAHLLHILRGQAFHTRLWRTIVWMWRAPGDTPNPIINHFIAVTLGCLNYFNDMTHILRISDDATSLR